jgi:hypothetical protein
MPPVGPRTSPSATTWSVWPPARGSASYAGRVVSLSVLHRLAYPAMTRLSRATHRGLFRPMGGAFPPADRQPRDAVAGAVVSLPSA